MFKLTAPIDSQIFITTVESMDRNKRPEYIFENLWKIGGGEALFLQKYAVEAKEYWESRCCSMLELPTPNDLYDAAVQGKLQKMQSREKDVIVRLARALCDEARLNHMAESDEISVENCYRAEALLKHINNKPGLIVVYTDFPHALRRRNVPHEELIEICNKALSLSREIGEKEGEMKALSNLGHLSEVNRDFASALGYYTQALSILDGIISENNIDDSPRTIPEEYLMPKAVILFNMGNCKGILGDVRDTVRLCTRAVEYANRMEPDGLTVHLHQLLARAYSSLGEHHTALNHLVVAGTLSELIKSPFFIGQTKMFVAVTYAKLGDFQKAIEYGLEAVTVYKLHETLSEYLVVSGRIGSIMVSAGEFERAKAFFNDIMQTIDNADKSINLDWQKSLVFRQLARIAIANNEWDTALSYLEFPLELIEDERKLPHLVVETLVIAADVYTGAKIYDKAKAFAQRTLKICSVSNDLQNQYLAHQQLATIAEQLNDVATAYFHYKEFHRLKELVFNNESDQRNKNMQILLEEKEALRIAQAERLRRYELEEEIGQLSTALVHREQALKEIRTTLRSMKTTNEHAEQVLQVLQSVIRSSESGTSTNSTKTYKLIDEAIATNFPKLSRVQRDLCRFIALGHTTKDIARLMGISVESVHTQRYRIRTRLALGDSDSLDLIIKQAVKQ